MYPSWFSFGLPAQELQPGCIVQLGVRGNFHGHFNIIITTPISIIIIIAPGCETMRPSVLRV